MKKFPLLLIVCFLIGASLTLGQARGNRGYGSGETTRKPQTNTGVLTGLIADKTQVQFIEASVLMNVPADSYVAVFALAQEAKTPVLSNEAVNAKFAEFIKALEGLGVKRNDVYVDFIAQNRIFDFSGVGSTITERLSGFETKKNIAVLYKDKNLLERILSVAGQVNIFDLVEVNYNVSDARPIRAKLYEEAVRIVKQKEALYTNTLGLRLTPSALSNEKYDAFFPSDHYQSYQAFESGDTDNSYNKTVIRSRKITTFFYEPLEAAAFDAVINPIGIEPVVQFTLYLRIQYDLPANKSK